MILKMWSFTFSFYQACLHGYSFISVVVESILVIRMVDANVKASKIMNKAETIWTTENYDMDLNFPYSVLIMGVGLVFGVSSLLASCVLRSSLEKNSGEQVISIVSAVHPSHKFTTLKEEAYPVPYNYNLGTHPWRGLKCIPVLLQEKHCKSFGMNYLYFACKLCFFYHILTLFYRIWNYAATLYTSVHSEYILIIANLRTNNIFHKYLLKINHTITWIFISNCVINSLVLHDLRNLRHL